MTIDGVPACRCESAGVPSRKLANALPVPSSERRPAGDRRGELEVAAVLEKPEHVPVELAGVAAELDRVLAGAPGHALADLEIVVPVLARRAQQRIADRIVSLDVEQRQAVGVFCRRIRRRGSRALR